MKNGFIYLIINCAIEGLEKLNMVEWLKWYAVKRNPHKDNKIKELIYSRFAVDGFITLKFIFVAAMWAFGIEHWVVTVFVWYLLVMNLQTYFYYHIWCKDAVVSAHTYLHRVRRRFITLFLAISFSNFSFAYLYACAYRDNFSWGDKGARFLQALWFSISNALAANYDVVKPGDDPVANAVCMCQLVMTFVFVTIILSKSIPQGDAK